MSNDIRDILQRISALEGKTVPVSPKGSMTSQQEKVPQLPALFRPKSASPVLKSKKDPQHPMRGYMVGDSVEPKKNSLEEAMQEVEEEMLGKVKNDLRSYLAKLDDHYADDGQRERGTTELDKLTDKEKVDRDLIQKAVKAVAKAEEEIEENDEYGTAPTAGDDEYGTEPAHSGDDYGTAGTDPMDSEAGHALQLKAQQVLDKPIAPIAPTESVAEDSAVFEICGDDESGYEIRKGNRAMRTRFPRHSDAEMAIKLFRNRRKPEQDLSQDYIEER